MAIKKVKLPNNTTLDINDARNVVIGDGADNIVTLTNAEYQALATKDPNTVYIITDVDPGGGGGGGGSGTVTSVAMSVPTGLSVSGSPITTSGTLAVSFANGYSIPTTTKQSQWDAKGTYSKPSGGIPATDLASAVQTSLGKADTALQSYTETDPTVPSWAKASSKPTYTASEVGALPDTTVVPTESTVSGWGFTKNAGTITGITMNGSSKGTSGVVNLGTVVTSESDPVFAASAAHGISSTDISNWNAKQKAITVSTSTPTSSQGSNGDIWIVI